MDTKTNEIPGARQLFKKLGRDGRKVSLDALHTQTQTARQLVLEPGADFLLTVKDHQPTLRANIESGLHQRLDLSPLDDQCRRRKPKSMRGMGMFRRFSNSLFMHWRNRQIKPQLKITTDFFSARNAEHHR